VALRERTPMILHQYPLGCLANAPDLTGDVIIPADQPDAPPDFTYDATLNARERSTLEATRACVLAPLTVEGLVRLRTAGARHIPGVRDVTDLGDGIAAWNASHLPTLIAAPA
jgi:hypothetical protein